jgi:hypothetical protein
MDYRYYCYYCLLGVLYMYTSENQKVTAVCVRSSRLVALASCMHAAHKYKLETLLRCKEWTLRLCQFLVPYIEAPCVRQLSTLVSLF